MRRGGGDFGPVANPEDYYMQPKSYSLCHYYGEHIENSKLAESIRLGYFIWNHLDFPLSQL